MINIIRTVGGSLGTAVLTVVLERRIVANVPGATGDLGALGGANVGRRGRRAAVEAFGQTFWVASGDDRPRPDPGVVPPAPRRPAALQRPEAPARVASLPIPTKVYNL